MNENPWKRNNPSRLSFQQVYTLLYHLLQYKREFKSGLGIKKNVGCYKFTEKGHFKRFVIYENHRQHV